MTAPRNQNITVFAKFCFIFFFYFLKVFARVMRLMLVRTRVAVIICPKRSYSGEWSASRQPRNTCNWLPFFSCLCVSSPLFMVRQRPMATFPTHTRAMCSRAAHAQCSALYFQKNLMTPRPPYLNYIIISIVTVTGLPSCSCNKTMLGVELNMVAAIKDSQYGSCVSSSQR